MKVFTSKPFNLFVLINLTSEEIFFIITIK